MLIVIDVCIWYSEGYCCNCFSLRVGVPDEPFDCVHSAVCPTHIRKAKYRMTAVVSSTMSDSVAQSFKLYAFHPTPPLSVFVAIWRDPSDETHAPIYLVLCSTGIGERAICNERRSVNEFAALEKQFLRWDAMGDGRAVSVSFGLPSLRWLSACVVWLCHELRQTQDHNLPQGYECGCEVWWLLLWWSAVGGLK